MSALRLTSSARATSASGWRRMMATLPGLPMFGHGQIEGFTEKYGMEYRRARYQEDPDRGLVARHEREIAPLLHQRWLFAESDNFLLYDFYRPDGSVDENVFAYSNRRGDHRALVIYHNRFRQHLRYDPPFCQLCRQGGRPSAPANVRAARSACPTMAICSLLSATTLPDWSIWSERRRSSPRATRSSSMHTTATSF